MIAESRTIAGACRRVFESKRSPLPSRQSDEAEDVEEEQEVDDEEEDEPSEKPPLQMQHSRGPEWTRTTWTLSTDGAHLPGAWDARHGRIADVRRGAYLAVATRARV